MKGNERKKESKKEKKDTTTKVQSEYQKDKTRKSVVDPIVFKPKK